MASAVFEHFPDKHKLQPEQFLARVLRARIQAAIDFPALESLLRAEIPDSLFSEQVDRTYARFEQGMKAFAMAYPDRIRVRHLDTAIELGTTLVESTVRALASHSPERLKDEVLLQEFIDVVTHYILKE
ncbi:hypothetical protein [Agaribacter flavus]|uniref:Tetracyclin repressor SlmA-like C-terminal domain-containing protein n=1 Tax=Agaribacter flavus TaxID=1902781 RepID=A0ABV7FQ11_9ALTE